MIFSVLKFPKVGYVYAKRMRWKIKLPFDGIFTQ